MTLHRNILTFGAVALIALFPLAAPAQTKTKKRGIKLPRAVAAALKTECPDCVIAKVTREVEDGVKIYDFEFRKDQGEMDIAPDGTIVNRETPMKLKDVPAAVIEAIRQAAPGARIVQIEKEEIRAALKSGTVIKLDAPKYDFEADLVKGKRTGEIVVTPEGRVTDGPKWRRRGTKED